MTWFGNIIYLCLFIGIFFMALGAVGLHRFSDVYNRLHAGTKCTTFGSIFIGLSIFLYALRNWFAATQGEVIPMDGGGQLNLAIHAFIAVVAIMITNPTSSHALARAAHKAGERPVSGPNEPVIDDLAKLYESVKEAKAAEENVSTEPTGEVE